MFKVKRLYSSQDSALTTEHSAQAGIATDNALMTTLASPNAATTDSFLFDHAPAAVPIVSLAPEPSGANPTAPDGAIQIASMAVEEIGTTASSAPTLAPTTMFGDATPAMLSVATPAAPTVIFIDPSAAAGGDGSAAQPFSSWLFAPLVAGNIYLQRAGTVLEGPLVLRGAGTDIAPILIGSYGTGAPPIVRGSIVIEQSAHLSLTGFTVEGSAYPAVIVRDGAHNITIAGNTIQDSGLGVWFGAGSGGGNLVTGNTISGNATHGIAFDKTDHRAEPTLVFNNVIRDNGSHGIEVNGNGVVVSGNVVSGNGNLVSGSSGIHVYGGVGQADGFGTGNIIVGNTVTNTYESGQGLDGNGIQLDQFTAQNIVMNNIVSGNDGAGIILYDSWANVVRDNTLEGNALDRSASRPWLAELMLATSPDVALDLTDSNVVTGNLITPRSDAVQAIWIDATTADNANWVGENTIGPAAVSTRLSLSGGLAGIACPDLMLCDAPLAAGGGDAVWGA